MNNSNIGCFGLIAIVFVFALAWQIILYIGLPLAMAGGGICYYMLKSENEDLHIWGWIVGGVSLLIGLASIVGNIYSNGPLNSSDEEAASSVDESENLIPVKYRGRWTTGNVNCDNYYSVITIDGDDLDFPDEIMFAAKTVMSESENSIDLAGITISVGESFKDSEWQDDSIKLSISNDGQTLTFNGSPMRRCANR